MEPKANQTSNEYLKTKIMTASPEQLQLMLYDGAIRFCEQARPAIRGRDIEKSYSLLTRAENIIMEMMKSMRDDIAPETCAKMRSLYLFCYEKLVEANLKKDIEHLDDALKVLRHMRETWLLLMDKLHREKHPAAESDAPSPPPAPPSHADLLEQFVGSTISLEG